MPTPRNLPQYLGFWPLLAPELDEFTAAWTGEPPRSQSLHGFHKAWKATRSWGGPARDRSLWVQLVQDACTSARQVRFSKLHLQTACAWVYQDSPRLQQLGYSQSTLVTASAPIVRSFEPHSFLLDLDRTAGEYRAFVNVARAYLWHVLTNRKDKALVTRVWLLTQDRMRDPDTPTLPRTWTDAAFDNAMIVRCIKRDRDLNVSIATVRAVLKRIREEQKALWVPADLPENLLRRVVPDQPDR